MTPIRCGSSQLMTNLLAWRNPQGAETNWMNNAQNISDYPQYVGKVIATEIALIFVVIISIIETVVYLLLAFICSPLYPCNKEPCMFFVKLLESSSFTIIWSLADVGFYNPAVINVMTNESFARWWAQAYNPTAIKLERVEDRIYVSEWQEANPTMNNYNPFLEPIIQAGEATALSIERGARFLKDDVLANATAETIESFKEVELHNFILSKAVYIYAVGSKKTDEIPAFFKPETRGLILGIREKVLHEKTIAALDNLFSTPEEFEKPFEKPFENRALKFIFNELRAAGSGELQGSLLSTGCWEKAIALLENTSSS